MKLVELLARELDVWPEQATHAIQEDTGVVEFTEKGKPGIKEGSWSVLANDADWPCLWLLGAGVNVTMLADDHSTSIITRADWQAERERIAGGWIAHDGGECPVARGVRVDVRYRYGDESMNQPALEAGKVTELWARNWERTGHTHDIIAYRLHKPEQQQPQREQEEMTPCEKLGYKVGDLFVIEGSSNFGYGEHARLFVDDGTTCPEFESVSGGGRHYADISFARPATEAAITVNIETPNADDPHAMRDRILEIDRTTEALEEERGQLVQRLADEGFKLLPVLGHSEPEEDMSDWRNWRNGDRLQIVDFEYDTHGFEPGSFVTMNRHDDNKGCPAPKCTADDGDYGWVQVTNLKFHSRPTV